MASKADLKKISARSTLIYLKRLGSCTALVRKVFIIRVMSRGSVIFIGQILGRQLPIVNYMISFVAMQLKHGNKTCKDTKIKIFDLKFLSSDLNLNQI